MVEPGPKRKKRTVLFWSLLLIPLLAILFYLIFVPRPVKVDSTGVKRGWFIETIDTDGVIRSEDRYIVPAFAEGELKRVDLKVGDPVKKGQRIADLNWDEGYVPIRAPVKGVVSKVFRESAGPIHRGEGIIEIVDPEKLEMMVELLTSDATQVQVGDPFTISNWGGESEIRGKVKRVSRAGFVKPSALGVEEEKTEITGDLGSLPKEVLKKLGNQYHVDVSIEIGRYDQALKLPVGAIFRNGDGWAVYRIHQKRAQEIPVTVLRRNQSEVMIGSGIDENDQVILYPGDLVKNGTRIKE